MNGGTEEKEYKPMIVESTFPPRVDGGWGRRDSPEGSLRDGS